MHSNLALWLLSIFASLTVRVWIWMWQMGKVKSSLFTQSKRCFTFVACHIRCYMFSVVRRFFLFYFQRYLDARMRACWQGDIYLIESWCEFFLSFRFLADFGIHFLFVFFLTLHFANIHQGSCLYSIQISNNSFVNNKITRFAPFFSAEKSIFCYYSNFTEWFGIIYSRYSSLWQSLIPITFR